MPVTEIIIVIALSYVVMASWVILYKFEQPPFMPFPVFKLLCSVGYKKPLSEFPDIFSGRSTHDFTSVEWRKWGEEIAKKRVLTNMAAYCFNQRIIVEIEKILEDTKNSEEY